MSFKNCILILLVCISLSCKKEAGEGGNSSIRGKIYVKNYNSSFKTLLSEYPGKEVEVYIIYGNESVYGNRMRASYDGMYEFKYLNPGKYKLYAFSADSTGAHKNQANPNAPLVAIIKDVEITSGKQITTAPVIEILDVMGANTK